MKILSHKRNKVKDAIKHIPDEIILESHKCAECGYVSKEIKIKFDLNPDYSRISKLHLTWDLSKGNLGYIICPKCKTCPVMIFLLPVASTTGNRKVSGRY